MQEDFERAIGILDKFIQDAEWMKSTFMQKVQDENEDKSEKKTPDNGPDVKVMKAFLRSKKGKK